MNKKYYWLKSFTKPSYYQLVSPLLPSIGSWPTNYHTATIQFNVTIE